MKSLIFDDTNKEIYICVHMEQVYSDIKNEKKNIDIYSRYGDRRTRSRRNRNYFRKNQVFDGNLFFDLNKYNDEKYKEYTWIFDLRFITLISENAIVGILNNIDNSIKKGFCNANKLSNDTKKSLLDKGFVEITEPAHTYIDAYTKKVVDYLVSNKECSISVVKNETGEKITNYINLKPFLENKVFLFPSCYLLAASFNEKVNNVEDLGEYAFFCHTLNGATIATTISLILGLDVVYADNLNVSGMIRKKYMPEHFKNERKCIIVTDMVCQGHEIIRAKDIIKMLGGECVGNICLISVEIAGKEKNKNEDSLLLLDSELKAKFNYEIVIGE